jgi:glucose-6-phosphate isomerase
MPARRRRTSGTTGTARAERIRLDYTGSLRDTVGAAGLTRDEIATACARAATARERLRALVDGGRHGFDEILDDRATAAACAEEGRRLARLADTLVVDGIGGSALGALAVQTALGGPRKRLVILDNVDPEGITQKLAGVNWKRAAAIAITKSGSTAETMANLLVLLSRMEKALGPKATRRWTAVTDPEKGDLKVLAGRLGIPTFDVPPNVGGRFSVLTPVGLIPAAFLGVDLDLLLEGARAMRKHCWAAAPEKNVGVLGAVLLHQMATRRGRSIQVLMPYADRLLHVADWYKQLWAESLGKRLDRKGRVVETGQTPVTALGATDQHSQVQLYVEGPHDKVVTFIELSRYRKDVRIPRLHQDLVSLGYLTGRTMGELLTAEKRGTEVALTGAGRPSFTYVVPEISAHTLGQLFYLFEFQTALSGELYDVDAFDQPGVEAGKVAAYALMGRAGYEKQAVELRRQIGKRRAMV